jgi:hypothetical protein
MSLHERSPSPSRNACSLSVPERAPSTTTVIEYDSKKMVERIRRVGTALRNAEFYGGCTHEEALDKSIRTDKWVHGPESDDTLGWFQKLNVCGDKRCSFVDVVADVRQTSLPDAFDFICENRDKINSIQEQNNCTPGEAARQWLLDFRKANISETAVQKLQDYREDLSEAQARELIFEHMDSVIYIHEKLVGIEWDDAQSRWAWGWIEENPRKRPMTRLQNRRVAV